MIKVFKKCFRQNITPFKHNEVIDFESKQTNNLHKKNCLQSQHHLRPNPLIVLDTVQSDCATQDQGMVLTLLYINEVAILNWGNQFIMNRCNYSTTLAKSVIVHIKFPLHDFSNLISTSIFNGHLFP